MNEDLIDAVNLLAEAAEKLPCDYRIELHFHEDETCILLFAPDGSEVEIHTDERSHFLNAIESAQEHA